VSNPLEENLAVEGTAMLPSQRSDESGVGVAVGVVGTFGMSMAYAVEAPGVGLSWRVDQAENLQINIDRR
jgi:hypothetical protein